MNNKKLLVTFFLIFTSILGCTNTQMFGTAIAIKVASDPRSIGTQVDNLTLKMRISSAFFNDSILKNQSSRISIIAYNNKILIIGQVLNYFVLNHIQKIVENYNNSKEIYNEIRISQPIELMQILEDSWISNKIRAKIIFNKKLKLRNLKIITENKEVFIFGDILKKEEKIIISAISKIDNINKIITFFEYI
ncbi:putative phospholipid-binding protein [Wigglesworthia glossinidia endosymbiont of Glossina morsitans morsitans (Yale colony)]|uniref:Putative phospholipid-binding protein n=1 Tax=Wigglesworthia glossinidia endosymbiont of Glossina morsitans morsitans (Yale colony) TaxID=1142511 RepID=H6Q5V0_WIGGL|nr:BON domain-containing protein [Wigglesworthia glossinidia]AFA41146.1 putative phospholipid-binding protein [Wigglesworthia glossinidia endosymbiont of Glossina morsitans morsitans (Yale colony)]